MACQVELLKGVLRLLKSLIRPRICTGSPTRRYRYWVLAGGVKAQTTVLLDRAPRRKRLYPFGIQSRLPRASGGEPRGLEDPFQRAKDIRSAVTFLSTPEEVDNTCSSALEICLSSGYIPCTAYTDPSIRVVL
jgi:hypothetical protein